MKTMFANEGNSLMFQFNEYPLDPRYSLTLNESQNEIKKLNLRKGEE